MVLLWCAAFCFGVPDESQEARPAAVKIHRPSVGQVVRPNAPLIVGGQLLGENWSMRVSDVTIEVLDSDGAVIAGTVIFAKQSTTYGHVFPAPPTAGWPAERLTVVATALDSGQWVKTDVIVQWPGEKATKDPIGKSAVPNSAKKIRVEGPKK